MSRRSRGPAAALRCRRHQQERHRRACCSCCGAAARFLPAAPTSAYAAPLATAHAALQLLPLTAALCEAQRASCCVSHPRWARCWSRQRPASSVAGGARWRAQRGGLRAFRHASCADTGFRRPQTAARVVFFPAARQRQYAHPPIARSAMELALPRAARADGPDAQQGASAVVSRCAPPRAPSCGAPRRCRLRRVLGCVASPAARGGLEPCDSKVLNTQVAGLATNGSRSSPGLARRRLVPLEQSRRA